MKPAVEKPKVVIICGPTGIGKTAAAVEMAQTFGGEIISADSMQIYKYMDIGTAKPTAEEQAAVRHHLIDIVAPDAHFDAARFAELANEKIIELHSAGIISFVVGGTGLYIKALVDGLFDSRPVDPGIRSRLKKESAERGSEALHRRLAEVDPDTAARVHCNDTYRIIRALEVFESSGRTLSEYHHAHGFLNPPFQRLKIGLHMQRAVLYDRIDRRVEAMIDAGFLDEVQSLLARGYGPELKSMQSIGYRHLVQYISGQSTWEETLRTLKRDTRQYAKRQLTWFRADPEIVWAKPGNLQEARGLISSFYKKD